MSKKPKITQIVTLKRLKSTNKTLEKSEKPNLINQNVFSFVLQRSQLYNRQRSKIGKKQA
jgi:hypothetical protein